MNRLGITDGIRIGNALDFIVTHALLIQRPHGPIGRAGWVGRFDPLLGVEQVVQPLFGLQVIELLMQPIGDGMGNVEKQLPEVTAIGAVKIHWI
ncbi:hypothetical protein D3C85_1183980 [compost metagenome]